MYKEGWFWAYISLKHWPSPFIFIKSNIHKLYNSKTEKLDKIITQDFYMAK